MKSLESSPRTEFFNRYRDDEDEYGLNLSMYETYELFFRFFYEKWFSVALVGIENIPPQGRAILCGNHSGVLPIDAFMLYEGMINKHPSPRRIRFLVTEFLRKAPAIGALIRGFGGVPAKYDVAIELLNNDELVFFYPEAENGTGKPFKERYNLRPFNPGFVKAAIQSNATIVPITTVGGDEIYPLLGNLKPVAKIMGAPYWPITPFYPLLPFPFSAMPLPIKMLICIGKPFNLDYPPEKADDHEFIEGIAKRIQRDIQMELNDLLKIRKSPFSKWDVEKVQAYHRHYM
ncbi:MAG: acyltransferase family protein [Cyanobacteria bacterium]|nr:acyltransferase family protein [Cyanobacteriota bacterium]